MRRVGKASGERVERIDGVGDETLGAFGRVVVDESSIGEWIAAYARSIEKIVERRWSCRPDRPYTGLQGGGLAGSPAAYLAGGEGVSRQLARPKWRRK